MHNKSINHTINFGKFKRLTIYYNDEKPHTVSGKHISTVSNDCFALSRGQTLNLLLYLILLLDKQSNTIIPSSHFTAIMTRQYA